MEASERLKIIEAIGMCTKCLNPRYVHKTAGEMRKHIAQIRSIRKRKNKYTCLKASCSCPPETRTS